MAPLRTSDFEYELPPELIAQTPVEPRDSSRLMAVSKSTETTEHRRFTDLPLLLKPGDVLVLNDSRVFPARLYGHISETDREIELLLLNRIEPGRWRALVKPGRRMRAGSRFDIVDGAGDTTMSGVVIAQESAGSRIVELANEDAIGASGVVPLPPYIHERLDDPERYQTVYSQREGSVAAPTAGLHMTDRLLGELRSKGVETVFVTLDVGWGSFKPVEENDPSSHEMHSEHWELSQDAADAINLAKSEGRRVVSVGTTAVRLLEHATSVSEAEGQLLDAGSGWADLFILPGFKFRVVDGLVTNFHLPKSTLLMLVSAFAGKDLVLDCYREAVEQRYRFYSLGDAMVIL
jgi:S-adenosylmethionine:tRNA ribosyltransferase-isomerase|tara:strand:- start:323 stop:1369 length:1047 start_codon:yes stop_codon:yes gene_type:complete